MFYFSVEICHSSSVVVYMEVNWHFEGFLHSDVHWFCLFRYDLVDLTRQVLSKLGNQIYLDAIMAYSKGDVDMLTLQNQRFIELIEDIDTLLSSDDNFLLGTWLENAKTLATSQKERRQVSQLVHC